MKRDILIGGAWPYANYYLHVGHLAALLPGDVIAKYYRMCGDNVIYVSGSDCHGTPITERAKKEGTTPKAIATFYHEEFVKTFNNIGFNYDLYTATMTDYHKKYVQNAFLQMINNGYIYEKEIEQDYCDTCNKFVSDREIVGTCPNCGGESTGDQCDNCLASLDPSQVLNKHCKTCGSSLTTKINKHLYFKLPEFKEELQKLLDKNKDKWRKNAIGETQKYIDSLVERATTRELDWGVEVPVKGYENKRIYVWIEAVLGYLSTADKVLRERGQNPDEVLSDNNQNLRVYMVHGKDNIPFHTTIFPALELAIGDNYRLPDYIISSAYVNLNNEKMSKSKGNLISVNELLELFNKDTLRFYFIFNGPEVKDISCSIEEMITVHNKFLVGTLGNFINRNFSFINKKFEGIITEGKVDSKIKETTLNTYKEVGELIEKGELKSALSKIMDYISLGNKYYDENTPWIKVKENIAEFNDITYTCTYMIVNIANLIRPFLSETSDKILNMLDISKESNWQEKELTGNIKIVNNELLFNRIDDEETKSIIDKLNNK